MPKLVDYVARFQDIRRAAHEVTLRDGPTALTLGAVAAEMGLSVSSLSPLMRSADALPRLGLQWAEAAMREHMFSVPLREQRSGDPVTRAALHTPVHRIPGRRRAGVAGARRRPRAAGRMGP